jgi:hypothetical protein
MRAVLFLLILGSLAACGSTPAPTPATVEAALSGAGASAFVAGETTGTAPRSYIHHAEFMIGDKGGQYFLCDTKKNCDALYAYYDALKALAGPYTFQSTSGLIVAQLNSALTPDQAAKIETALKGL